jgi:hypothetical protein
MQVSKKVYARMDALRRDAPPESPRKKESFASVAERLLDVGEKQLLEEKK